MIRPEHLIDTIARANALLKSQRHKAPVKIRIHPLDLAVLRRRHAGARADDGTFSVLGIPAEPDCAVTRGEPVAEYE